MRGTIGWKQFGKEWRLCGYLTDGPHPMYTVLGEIKNKQTDKFSWHRLPSGYESLFPNWPSDHANGTEKTLEAAKAKIFEGTPVLSVQCSNYPRSVSGH
jgi:hypothetical protein